MSRFTWKQHLVLLIFIIGFAFSVWQVELSNHELVHERICEYNNGNVTSKYVGLFEGYVRCDTNNNNTYMLNSMNEIVGYHADALIYLGVLIFAVLVYILAALLVI